MTLEGDIASKVRSALSGRLQVRSSSECTVFEIHPDTWDPMTTAVYDPYCFSDPDPGVEYIEFFDWLKRRNEQREELEP